MFNSGIFSYVTVCHGSKVMHPRIKVDFGSSEKSAGSTRNVSLTASNYWRDCLMLSWPADTNKVKLKNKHLGSTLTSRQRQSQLNKRHEHQQGQLLLQWPHDGEHNTHAGTLPHTHKVWRLAQEEGVICDVIVGPPTHVRTSSFSYLSGVLLLASMLTYVP